MEAWRPDPDKPHSTILWKAHFGWRKQNISLLDAKKFSAGSFGLVVGVGRIGPEKFKQQIKKLHAVNLHLDIKFSRMKKKIKWKLKKKVTDSLCGRLQCPPWEANRWQVNGSKESRPQQEGCNPDKAMDQDWIWVPETCPLLYCTDFSAFTRSPVIDCKCFS